MNYRIFSLAAIGVIATIALIAACRPQTAATTTGSEPAVSATPSKATTKGPSAETGVYDLVEFDGQKITHTEEVWKKLLTPDQFYILREAGTERAYTGALTNNHEEGVYYCAACGLALFHSKAKFESGTGWPSFYEPIYKKNVTEKVDNSLGETRTEVLCSRCGGHLGHVFDDGPQPTGLRYCMNSAALKFKKQ
jgi:peptide-methionine (R)-S-oxide reductase